MDSYTLILLNVDTLPKEIKINDFKRKIVLIYHLLKIYGMRFLRRHYTEIYKI
ncbi:hypothetical protein ES703_09631 [subsurface metagenome]